MLNPTTIREQFPALNQTISGTAPIFFDGPGGMQVPKAVPEAMTDYLLYQNANLIRSAFITVQATHQLLATARANAAAMVNAPSSDNMIFGASMSGLTARISRAISREWQAGDEIITTALDHFANVSFWKMAAEDRGATCHQARINPADGTLDIDHLMSLITPHTRLIAFTRASNVTGSYVDPAPIIAAAKKVGALTYVDGVHATPHRLPDVREMDCDFLAISAYKFGGPHLGILYGKDEHLNRLTPYKVESAPSSPPECWEAGTKNFEALAGFNAIIDYMCQYAPGTNRRNSLEGFYQQLTEYEHTLSRHFITRAAELENLTLYGITNPDRLRDRTPTFAMRMERSSPQNLSDKLSAAQIVTGAGHFYAQGLVEALGVATKGGVLRAGMLHYNTIEEIDRFFEVLV
jgi:cysteine desulfurase family protein (TIGR01976 family)